MILFALIKPIWSCDPATGTPSEIYPQDQSVDIALDTHILLKMIHMVSDYVPLTSFFVKRQIQVWRKLMEHSL